MKDDINGLILCGFIFLLILGISTLLRSGRGAKLISGYNILPAKKKALYNEKALCRFYGNLLLVVDFFIVLLIIAGIFELTWLIILLAIIVFIISIAATIYGYTSTKFRNNSGEDKHGTYTNR